MPRAGQGARLFEIVPDLSGLTYGKNYDRLAKIKKRYDPENLFRVNQNIKPAK